jgi:DNA-binding transcriptional MerR regulator
MKTGEAAKLLGVDPATVRAWINHPGLSEFFSSSAKGEHGGHHRLLMESDVLILNTVRHLRTNDDADWSTIAETLRSGHREQEFPQNAISIDSRMIPIPQAEQAAKYMATVAERDAALAKVDELEQHLAQKEAEVKELRERLLQERLADQNKIGRLEMQVEMLQKQIDELRNRKNE